jgi:VHS domain
MLRLAKPATTSRVRDDVNSRTNQQRGDEITFLPPIVDAAESSPAAAAECARIIKKYLSKDYYSRPSWQYNALMLIRILVDNPGETFTRALDADFVETMRKLIKHAKETRVRGMAMEMFDEFEFTKMYDEGLQGLILMWKAQKEEAIRKGGVGHLVLPEPP